MKIKSPPAFLSLLIFFGTNLLLAKIDATSLMFKPKYNGNFIEIERFCEQDLL